MAPPARPVKERVRDFGKRTLNRLGLEVTRNPYLPQFLGALERLGLETVVDVGANTGQYVHKLRNANFRGRVLSVEPSQAAFAALTEAASGDAAWTIVRTALADSPGTVTLNIAGNSQSSSVLPMLDLHRAAGPGTAYVGTEDVPATTLDDLFATHGLDPSKCFVKIDVQGFEGPVLDGGSKTLATVGGVELELSLAPLYEGQLLMPAMVERMEAAGLTLWSLRPAWADQRTGRLLQVDGVFLRLT